MAVNTAGLVAIASAPGSVWVLDSGGVELWASETGNSISYNSTVKAPSVAALADGRFVVAAVNGDQSDGCVTLRVSEETGVGWDSELLILNQTKVSTYYPPKNVELISLTGNQFLVKWESAHWMQQEGGLKSGAYWQALITQSLQAQARWCS